MCVSPFQEHKKVRVPAKGCMPWSIHYSSGPTIYSKPLCITKMGLTKTISLENTYFFLGFVLVGNPYYSSLLTVKPCFFEATAAPPRCQLWPSAPVATAARAAVQLVQVPQVQHLWGESCKKRPWVW